MIAPVVAVLAGAWLVLLVVTPLLPTAVSALTYAAASLICHQRPERSFHVDLFQLPVCARCLGIYAGAAAGCVAALVPASGPSRVWRLTLVAVLPTVVTVALEWLGVWSPGNLTRALAGVPAGFAVALVVTRVLATVHYGQWAPRRPTAPNPPPSSI